MDVKKLKKSSLELKKLKFRTILFYYQPLKIVINALYIYIYIVFS